jgi:hypothetical protein
MHVPANTAAEREARLNEVILAYLKAREAGPAPDPRDWVARHPDLAAELEEFFASEEHIDRVAGRPRAQDQNTVTAAGATPVWGAGAVTAGGPAAAAAGLAVPGYEVLEELGRGGMGVVYRARQTSLGRTVALKMILSGPHAGVADLARFRAEAQAVARLQHPNIVQVHEVGEHGGLPFFSLEFVEGGSLASRLDGTPWQPAEAARLVLTLARAVGHAHARGVVHRDLKPGNTLLAADGTPKVTDFGLAKRLAGEPGAPATGDGLTQSGAILGTPSYMAPEQAAGKAKDVGPAADVYALGAIFYELLTGRPPFRGPTPLDTVRQVLADEPVPPRRLNPRVGRDPDTVCLKCLEKDPARRYASAEALADDLRRYLRGEAIRARPVPWWDRAWRWCRRRPGAAAAAAVAALAVLVVFGVVFGFNRQLRWQLGRTQDAERGLRAALTRQVAERMDGDLRQLAAAPQMMAAALAVRPDWTEAQLAAWMRQALAKDDRLFGMCAAFEPGEWNKGRQDYALYACRRGRGVEVAPLPPKYRYRERPWYTRPRDQRKASWSEPFFDEDGGNIPMVTYSVPLYRRGKFAGVVTTDLSLEYFKVLRGWLDELHLGREGYAFVVSARGAFISHPTYAMTDNIRRAAAFRADDRLRALAERLLREPRGSASAPDPVTGRPASFDFARVPTSGWVFVAVTPE